jgi:hypothetical protein
MSIQLTTLDACSASTASTYRRTTPWHCLSFPLSSFFFHPSPSASTDPARSISPPQTTREARLCARRRLDRVQPRVKIPPNFSFTSSRRGTSLSSHRYHNRLDLSLSLSPPAAPGGVRAYRISRAFGASVLPSSTTFFFLPFFRRTSTPSPVLRPVASVECTPYPSFPSGTSSSALSSALFIVALGRSISDVEGRQMQAHREGKEGGETALTRREEDRLLDSSGHDGAEGGSRDGMKALFLVAAVVVRRGREEGGRARPSRRAGG